MKAGFVAAWLPSAATIASVVSQTKPRVHGGEAPRRFRRRGTPLRSGKGSENCPVDSFRVGKPSPGVSPLPSDERDKQKSLKNEPRPQKVLRIVETSARFSAIYIMDVQKIKKRW